jgi:hypothetical protein
MAPLQPLQVGKRLDGRQWHGPGLRSGDDGEVLAQDLPAEPQRLAGTEAGLEWRGGSRPLPGCRKACS